MLYEVITVVFSSASYRYRKTGFRSLIVEIGGTPGVCWEMAGGNREKANGRRRDGGQAGFRAQGLNNRITSKAIGKASGRRVGRNRLSRISPYLQQIPNPILLSTSHY